MTLSPETKLKKLREHLAAIEYTLEGASSNRDHWLRSIRQAERTLDAERKLDAERNARWQVPDIDPLFDFGGYPEGPATQKMRKRIKLMRRELAVAETRLSKLLAHRTRILRHIAETAANEQEPDRQVPMNLGTLSEWESKVITNRIVGCIVTAAGLAMLQDAVQQARAQGHSDQAILRRVEAHHPSRVYPNLRVLEFLGLKK